MSGLLAGAIGFLLFYPTDWLQLRGATRARALLLLLGSIAQTIGLFLVLVSPEKLQLPAPATWLGLVLLPVAVFLMIYSLFLEIPFARAFLPTGQEPPRPGGVVSTGTYALTRHPGVLWYALLILALLLASGSAELLLAGPVWIALDALWVVIQDRVYFPRILPGYREYAETTPMLIPNRGSVAACFRTLPRRRRYGNPG